MELEHWKTWHWMLIGLLVGLGMGYFNVAQGPNIDRGVTKTLYQDEFESKLLQTYQPAGEPKPPKEPVISNVVVHPPIDGVVWVTGTIIDIPPAFKLRQMIDLKVPLTAPPPRIFRLETRMPYKPKFYPNLMGPTSRPTGAAALVDKISPKPADSIVNYLEGMKGAHKDSMIAYRYAWWELPKAVLTLWTAGGFLLIGVIWPVIINLIVGAGLIPEREKKADYDLDRFKGEASAAAAVAAPKPEMDINALNDAMEEKLAGFARDPDDIETERENAEVVSRLANTRLELNEAMTKEEQAAKEYKGEFYPVVKSSGHAKKPE